MRVELEGREEKNLCISKNKYHVPARKKKCPEYITIFSAHSFIICLTHNADKVANKCNKYQLHQK